MHPPPSQEFKDGQAALTCRDIIPQGTWHKLFLLNSFLIFAAVVVLTSLSFISAKSANNTNDEYLAILILVSSVWYIYFAFHGVYRSNVFDVIAFLFAVILVDVYVAYRFGIRAKEGTLDAIQYAGLIVILSLSLIHLLVSIKLFQNFDKWRLLKLSPSLKRDRRLRKLYRWYEGFTSLLKIDLNFGVIHVLVGFFFFVQTIEIILSAVAIFVIFVWAVLGNASIRLEDSKAIFVFYVLSLLEPIHIIERLIKFNSGSELYQDIPLFPIMFVGIVALVIRAFLILCVIRLHLGFKSGLKYKVFDPETEEEPVMSKIFDSTVQPYLTLTVKKFNDSKLGKKLSVIGKSFSKPSLDLNDTGNRNGNGNVATSNKEESTSNAVNVSVFANGGYSSPSNSSTQNEQPPSYQEPKPSYSSEILPPPSPISSLSPPASPIPSQSNTAVEIPPQPSFDSLPPEYVTNVNNVPQEPVIIPEIVSVPQEEL